MSATQQNVIEAIYGVLSGDTGAGGVSTLVSGRIYEGEGAQNATLPYVQFSIVTDPPNNFFAGGQDIEVEFDVNVYGFRRQGSKITRAIGERINTLLHRQPITVTGATGCYMFCLDRGGLDTEEDSYRQLMRWKLAGTGA